jgi:uncharacterized Tic20 family protein
METNSLTSDEKLMGALAHLFGPLGAIIIWAIQKDKSRFVKFQSLQALIFDVVITVGMSVLFLCFFTLMFLGMFGLMFTTLNNSTSPKDAEIFFGIPFMFPFTIFACVLPVSFPLLLFRLIAMFSVINGKNFHYPILGKWLENFLSNE